VDIEEFALGNSVIHKLDPRAKIIAALLFSAVVALSHSLLVSALSFCFPVLLVILARISVIRLLRRMATVNAFMVMLWFVLPLTVPGREVYSIGPIAIYQEGLISALSVTLKSNAIILTVIALLGTSPVFALVHALSHLCVPDKLVHLFFFCFRYVHVIHHEFHALATAAKVRGFRPGTNWHTYRTYAHLLGMLLVRSFDRSARILAAMKCRGFKGRFYILHDYEMKKLDYLMAVTSLMFAVGLMVAG
jgi:cobalt/nickel transport system permease protein